MARPHILMLVGSYETAELCALSELYARGCERALSDHFRFTTLHRAPDGAWRVGASVDTVRGTPALSLPEALSALGRERFAASLPQMFCVPGMTEGRALLDGLDMPMIGNPADVMGLCADKARTKTAARAGGLRVPQGCTVAPGGSLDSVPALPVIVKPVASDNSDGLTLVTEHAQLPSALALAHSFGDALVEAYIPPGREMRCGVIERNGKLHALLPEEYPLPHGVRTKAEKIAPAADGGLQLMAKSADRAWIVDKDDPVVPALQGAARQAFTALGCRDYGLFDFRVDEAGDVWFIEASPYCSFSPDSVIAAMAAADGLSLPDLLLNFLTPPSVPDTQRSLSMTQEPTSPAHLAHLLREFARHAVPEIDTALLAPTFEPLLRGLIFAPATDQSFADGFASAGGVEALGPIRMLGGAMNLPLVQVFTSLAQAIETLAPEAAPAWRRLANTLTEDRELGDVKLRRFLTDHLSDEALRAHYAAFAEQLAETHPHALYPTSAFRACDGHVQSTPDARTTEAVMSVTTFSSVRVRDHVLDPADTTLRDIYAPLGRCVAFVDSNVDEHYGEALQAYADANGFTLTAHVFRAMEADKGLATVERMLGDMKAAKVGRHEPVLVMGGGVLADTGGLACALYGRNTPYVMLSTSIVTGIDAGPSPRTCCDGFGYKNLLGAYHPPVVSLTDRHFFGTLRDGWVRHGVAEIIKMAVVKNIGLFEDLEAAQDRLVDTRFGMKDCAPDDPIHALSQRILAEALKSYIEAEYDNLYETHQCRPHAYGHTWSPGFEIDAGLLHGHAVSIGMGLGAMMSFDAGWITRAEMDRIHALISGYGLSLWDDVLLDEAVMVEAHRKMIAKRGGNLVAPLPKGAIGQCGYLDTLTERDLPAAVERYREICAAYPRGGVGVEPLCEDVGLEAASAATASGPLGQRLPEVLPA